MTNKNIFPLIILETKPMAMANITGNAQNPKLYGNIYFYNAPSGGTIVNAEVYGLPDNDSGFYGMHIHETGDCTLPFDKTGMHYNPTNSPHPQHAGDMPPLLGNNGYAWTAFYTDRFDIKDIINRCVIIHHSRDDFTTQPSGDSGEKIGCGVIKEI